MRLARSVVALTIVLATTTSYMTRTSYAEDTAYAEVTTTTAVTAKYVPTTNMDKDLALGEFSESFEGAAKAFITPPAPKVTVNYARAAGSSAGNTYAYGYCTWYVKSKMPSLPNSLGNAYAWATNAASQGLSTGSTPAAGSAGVEKGHNHVVYIEWVSPDKTMVKVSEMNYGINAVGVPHTRTVSANAFQYIYM